jgi:uncharacterized surface protein with fasciclin (FAS1) repeats
MPHEQLYTVTVYRDPQTLKRLEKPQEFKHPNSDEAQEHAQRLLKAGLKHHDFTILAPTNSADCKVKTFTYKEAAKIHNRLRW